MIKQLHVDSIADFDDIFMNVIQFIKKDSNKRN